MRPRSYPPEVKAAVLADYASGMTSAQAAEARGVSKSVAADWVKRAGLSRPRTNGPLDRKCTVEGCDAKHHALGYCNLHYGRNVLGYKPREFDPTERLEDCRWMAETGECLDGAAQRLGMQRKALEKWLWSHDRACLAALVSRQPRDHNRFAATDISIYELTGLRGRRDRQRREEARRASREDGAA